jgi:hypothetical protein
VLKTLAKLGANIFLRNQNDLPNIFHALNGEVETLRTLVELGFDANAKFDHPNAGRTVLHYATGTISLTMLSREFNQFIVLI